MDQRTRQYQTSSLTVEKLRRAIEISIAGFGGDPATPATAGGRAQVFVCALSGFIGPDDQSLSDAIYSIIQAPAVAVDHADRVPA